MTFQNLFFIVFSLTFLFGRRLDAFVAPTQPIRPTKHSLLIPNIKDRCETRFVDITKWNPSITSSTSLHDVGATIAGFVSRPLIKIAAMFFASFLASYKLRLPVRFFWPGLLRDPDVSNPLPPMGSLGCPWLGNNLRGGNNFFRNRSRRLGDPRVWMYYFLGKPVACVTGLDLIQRVNNMEFLYTQKIPSAKGFGLATEPERESHSFQRRLIGHAMKPDALREAVPALQTTAQQIIEDNLVANSTGPTSTPVSMKKVCLDFSLDTVQSQLIGFNSTSPFGREHLRTWTRGNKDVEIPFFYVKNLIELRMEDLNEKGPDSSTLSKMMFASEPTFDGKTRQSLAPGQVVNNTLGLIQAGVQPSAEVLTQATLLLGIHTDEYQLLVEEQKKLQKQYGDQLTYDMLDETNSPFLNGVVREALRMGAGKGSSPKLVTETIVVDGKQIPKGSKIVCNSRLTHQLDSALRNKEDAHMNPFKGFCPERWFAESEQAPRPADYCPFGAGPRMCLGAPLAMLQLKTFLAVFARQVESFELVRRDKKIKWNSKSTIPIPLGGVDILNIETTNITKKVEAREQKSDSPVLSRYLNVRF